MNMMATTLADGRTTKHESAISDIIVKVDSSAGDNRCNLSDVINLLEYQGQCVAIAPSGLAVRPKFAAAREEQSPRDRRVSYALSAIVTPSKSRNRSEG